METTPPNPMEEPAPQEGSMPAPEPPPAPAPPPPPQGPLGVQPLQPSPVAGTVPPGESWQRARYGRGRESAGVRSSHSARTSPVSLWSDKCSWNQYLNPCNRLPWCRDCRGADLPRHIIPDTPSLNTHTSSPRDSCCLQHESLDVYKRY